MEGIVDRKADDSDSFEKEPTFENVIEGGTYEALNRIEERYGSKENENFPERLFFHGLEHTLGVINRAEKIAKALGATEREIGLAKIAAAWHDVVQKTQEDRFQPNGVRNRNRSKPLGNKITDGNEAASSQELMEWLAESELDEVLEESELSSLKLAIAATTPPEKVGFGLIDEYMGPKIDQPILDNYMQTGGRDPVVLSVAMADLGTLGMETSDEALRSGDGEYIEARFVLLKLYTEKKAEVTDDEWLERFGNVPDDKIMNVLDPTEKKAARESMINWQQGQIGFAEYQRRRFHELPDDVRDKLGDVFNKFDENIVSLKERYAEAQAMDFETLAKEMGFAI